MAQCKNELALELSLRSSGATDSQTLMLNNTLTESYGQANFVD